MNYDVIVAGAGSAGGMTAYALAKKGINVALIDRKEEDLIGKKVCGDAIAGFHFDRVQKTGLHFPTPSGDECRSIVNAIDIYSPDLKSRLELNPEDFAPGEVGFLVDRLLFGQRIKNYAVDSGATLFSSCKVNSFITENETIVGVRLTEKKGGASKEIRAKVVVDATGVNAALRKKVPGRYEQHIEKTLAPIDMAFAYREVREIDAEVEHPDRLRLIFDAEWIPSGYIWIFPRDNGTVNTGIGGSMDRKRNLRELLQRYLATNPIFENSKLIDAGSGKIPTRRPLNSLVADNFALIGDSGAQVNPLHAGGLGVNVEASVKLANTITNALESGNTSIDSLWSYNIDYMRNTGAGHAPLDLFRLLVATLDNNAINKIMSKEIVSQEDIFQMTTPEGLQFGIGAKIKKLTKSFGVFRPTLALAKTAGQMQKIKQVYENYPEPDGFQSWTRQVESIYAKSIKPP
ncbi:MAG: geranylgeranyl reductase family protein [Candidatus Heimdallarchaeota archaeon]